MLRVLVALTAWFFSSVATAQPVTILVLGDSLTAGLGLPAPDAFPSKLETALRAKGHDVRVVNAGVSGDTSSDGRDRLDWALDGSVNAVIVELGANDALRGVRPEDTRRALDDILATLQSRKLPVLVAGMKAPRNLGPQYTAAFDPIFAAVANKHDAVFYPFFLDGVAADPALNQADGIHPNAEGVDVIVGRMLPSVEKLLEKVTAK